MGPIIVALLATLLPTCLLTFGLACLSTCLFLKLRRMHKENKALRARPPSPTEELPAPLVPKVSKFPELNRRDSIELSDATNPDWQYDLFTISSQVGWWPMLGDDSIVIFNPISEIEAKEILNALGYQGAPTAVLLNFLRNKKTRRWIMHHIIISIAFARTSFVSGPESTLLPFSQVVQKDLLTLFKAVEGIKLSPEVAAVLMTIPSQLYPGQKGAQVDRIGKIIDLLDLLFRSFAGHEDTQALAIRNGGKGRVFSFLTQEEVFKGFVAVSIFQQRMLCSRRQFELRWVETTEKVICDTPALYAHAGKDGVLLDEPKCWWKGTTLDVAEDGSLTERDKDKLGDYPIGSENAA